MPSASGAGSSLTERDPSTRTPRTPLSSTPRAQVLYGLNWAKAEASRIDELVVCEGYTDVIGCHLAGIERAVATCGTALTPQHARAMARFSKRVVLAFDADGAGQAAAERVYEWEEEFGLRFAVAALPEGSDPGDLAGTDPDALRAAIQGARPFLEFRVDRELGRGDLGSAEGPRTGLPPPPCAWWRSTRTRWCATST